ncbi:dienelactone hydrolase family protein [Luteimonas sp. MC1828]|uniref:alpha/beta hydrolase family protein n=1 Tax=Luteimonas sp. MC1828 TaxID=2799787 RepID=UPI0018F1E179|nr:dienelactone hydrolase family protein [Luteimonas sp. MC1828]MBJ7573698.1 dienelactone hydrolase family protein [Luteimonas sp. MC1828]
MKWVKRIAVVLGLLAFALTAYAVSTARDSDRPVGFQTARVESGSGPIAVALWYPTSGTPRPTTFVSGNLLNVARDAPVLGTKLPVVLVSHGNDGSALSHVDLAMELASAGYVVAAPTHAGDNYADRSRQSSPALFSQRAEQMRATLDFVLEGWPGASSVDASRVGAYGLSAGGFGVLTLVGARPDMAAVSEHCRRTPEFICKVLGHVKSPLLDSGEGSGVFLKDPRIRAAAVAAPGLGFTLAGNGLSDVDVPVQVWSGEKDDLVPFATNTRIVLDGLGPRALARQMAGATHLSFLAPCGLLKPPALCSDPEGFDRLAAHKAMNAELVSFFNSHLGAPVQHTAPAP